MNIISEAICFAADAFDGKKRKADNSPAIFHSLEAAAIVQELTGDEQTVCASVLHDTVEDTDVTLSQIREKFGERVAFLVSSETEEKYRDKNSSETWMLRKTESLKVLKDSADVGVKAMWLGDKLSNIRSFARLKQSHGDEMWQFFNQKDKKAHEWYYSEVARELAVFSDTECFKEYTALIKKVFGE